MQVRVLGKEVKDLEQRNVDLKTKLAAAEAFAMVGGSRLAKARQMSRWLTCVGWGLCGVV